MLKAISRHCTFVFHVLGYRPEFWQKDERDIQSMLAQVGLADIRTSRLTWKCEFENGSKIYDFLVATSGAWWYDKCPLNKRKAVSQEVRHYFEHSKVREITMDVVFGYGRKPRFASSSK